MSSTIAITGATGFIGKAICRRLRQQGHTVRALARSSAPTAELACIGVQLVSGSLADPNALQQLLDGADTAIHCAGAVRGRNQTDFDSTNVEGTRKLLAALAGQTTAARLLVFSSLAAREPGLSFYATSKFRCEEELKSQQQVGDWTVLRPPAVYGPGDKEMLPLFKLMQKGIAVTPGNGNARVSLIYIDDLVDAVSAWLQTPLPPGQVFHLSDPNSSGYSWAEIARIAADYFGHKVRVLPVPRLLLDSVAQLNLATARIFSYLPMLTPAKLRELRHPDWVCSSEDFSRATGWHAQVALRQGLEKTLA